MKEIRVKGLLKVIGEVDTELLTEADLMETTKTIRHPKKTAHWIWVCAACLCIAVVGIIGGVKANRWTKPWPVYTQVIEIKGMEVASCVAKKWDEQQNWERYNGTIYNGMEYGTTCKPITEEEIASGFGDVEMFGFDMYTDSVYYENAEGYDIHGIARDCAFAVRFADTEGYYIYASRSKYFETLGDMIQALDLHRTLRIDSAYYGETVEIKENGNTEYHIFKADISTEKIWEMLLYDGSLLNVANEKEDVWREKCISIGVDVPAIGCENHAIWLTKDGYLCTNILETGKSFYIGEQRVQEFMKYIETCQKSEYVTVFPSEEETKGNYKEAIETVTMTTQVQVSDE